MSRRQVSVIIPAFNCRPWIHEAIDSELNQSTPPREIIVVDDGSTDDTAAIEAEYGHRINYLYQNNQGVAAARNAGLRMATGEFIAFLDADDVWHPRKLEMQLRAIARRPELGLVGTGRFVWPGMTMPGVDETLCLTAIQRTHLAVRNCLTASSVLLRRTVAAHAGYFDTTLNGPEDHDYWLRCAYLTSAALLDIPLTGYRSAPNSLSKRADSMESGMRRILFKLDAIDYWHGDRLLRRRAYSYASYACAYMHGAAGDQSTAIVKLFRSVACYPLPFSRRETDVSFGRLRRLVVTLLRLLRLKDFEPAL